jgi:protein TonB
MSKDPKTNPPHEGTPQESLEDLVYRSNLAGGSKELRGASPWVAIPVTVLTYAVCGVLVWTVAKHTEAGKKVIKTMGISLQEESEAPPPPPPPPPPAPAAPAAPPPRIQQKEAPPPPPIDPRQDRVPEVAPSRLPEKDNSQRYAGSASSSASGVPGGGVTGGGGPSTGMAIAGAGQGRIVDFDSSQMKVKYQPPPPAYPPLAKIAHIQGVVKVEIVVGPDGIPISAHAVEGPSQLRAVAENYAQAWKFEPAMVNGMPITARFYLTMPFRLK